MPQLKLKNKCNNAFDICVQIVQQTVSGLMWDQIHKTLSEENCLLWSNIFVCIYMASGPRQLGQSESLTVKLV